MAPIKSHLSPLICNSYSSCLSMEFFCYAMPAKSPDFKGPPFGLPLPEDNEVSDSGEVNPSQGVCGIYKRTMQHQWLN